LKGTKQSSGSRNARKTETLKMEKYEIEFQQKKYSKKTFSCSNIVNANFSRLCMGKSFHMGIDQVSDIDIVPYTRAISSFIVYPFNLKPLT
jgi:hypothetical protein